VAIGAIYNDGTTGTLTDNRGHVRIYQYSVSKTVAQPNQNLANFGPIGWNRLGSDIDGESADDNFGQSVSLSANGRTVAIGAILNNGNGTRSGHVRIYQYSADKTVAQPNQNLANFGPVGWNRLGSDIDGEASGDKSGQSVSLSADGRIVAIGAIENNDGTDSNSGHVRIFSYNGTAWSQLGLDIDGEAAGDQSGYSVYLSADGRTVAVGACSNDSNGNNSGHVRIYNIDSSYDTNDTITIGAVFSEPVNITNTPVLNVLTNLDEATKLFSYASGTGTNVLYFTKTINSGENIDPLKILKSTVPTLTGGTIKDSDLNNIVIILRSDITFHSTIIATAIYLISYLPADIDNILRPTIKLTFNENVYSDSGNIIIKQELGDITIETINITSFNISGKNATYTLTNPLKYNHSYYIEIDATAIINYTGVSDKSMTFSTKKKYSSSLYENGGWENPEYLDTFTGNKRMFGGGNKKNGAPDTQGMRSFTISIKAKRTSTKKWNMFG
jgi:hypothetical protein